VDATSFADAHAELKASSTKDHKLTVNLDIKVKKWKGLPESLSRYLASLRAQTAASFFWPAVP
jgi:hypothetical protein